MLDLCEFVSIVAEMSHYYFPREILEEILHRLPLKSLVNCISVCKSWKSLISDYSFICDHLKRTIQSNPDISSLFLFISLKNRVEGSKYCESQDFYFLHSDNHHSYDDPSSVLKSSLIPLFMSDHKEVVGTCNGLVCLANYSVLDTADLIIWNPCVRKYLVLPKPSVSFRFYDPDHKRNRVLFGFGFDSKAKDFKVVRLVATINNKEETPQVEIYSLATGSWRNITGKAPPPILMCMQVLSKYQVFMNGVIHWVVSQRRNGRIHNFILTLDLVEEEFGELMLPQPLRESPYQLSILAGEDLLAVVHTYCSEVDEEFISIWVMKEDSWSEVFISNSRSYGGISSVLAIRNSGELVLRMYGGMIILLDPVNKSVKDLGPRNFVHAFAGFHVESLFLINEQEGVSSY